MWRTNTDNNNDNKQSLEEHRWLKENIVFDAQTVAFVAFFGAKLAESLVLQFGHDPVEGVNLLALSGGH